MCLCTTLDGSVQRLVDELQMPALRPLLDVYHSTFELQEETLSVFNIYLYTVEITGGRKKFFPDPISGRSVESELNIWEEKIFSRSVGG